MEDSNYIIEDIKIETAEDYKKQSELNDMKQHANKIIHGIKRLDNNDANRAIWELFQNAVDLSEECNIWIKHTENTFEFSHNGEPFNPMTLDCLFKQVSSKTLAEKKDKLDNNDPIGQYGTGTLEIINLTKQSGLKKPIFSEDKGFKVVLWRPSSPKNNPTIHDAIHDTIHDTIHEKSGYISIEELPERLLAFMDGEMNRNEIMVLLQLKNRDNFIKNYLTPAILNEWIEMTIPEKPTSKKQKYRLTKKGSEFKSKLIKR